MNTKYINYLLERLTV